MGEIVVIGMIQIKYDICNRCAVSHEYVLVMGIVLVVDTVLVMTGYVL